MNNNSFIGVAIQYRLGAFGFLSSDEVYRNGAVNAGLYDVMFAFQWIQQHISKFSGDPSRVTITGVSAGAGAVMLAVMSYGGTLGNTLFSQAIASSPYLPKQYGYKDWVPSQTYYAFAHMAGCAPTAAYGAVRPTILECLRSKSTDTLILASQNVSASGAYGTWAFLPVTDGELIQSLPSQQLGLRKVNGMHMLTGNSANEGSSFVPSGINTEEDLVKWLKTTFPLFSNDDIAKLLLYYPSTNASVSIPDPLFATNGISGPSALNQSSVATGQQQRAYNIYAESTFVCPSYWLAEAYAGDRGKQAWKYQYSVPLALHANDVGAYLGPTTNTQGPDLSYAFRSLIGNFVTKGNPSISSAIANGNLTTSNNASAEAASNWPSFSITQPHMLNLNQTGGQESSIAVALGLNTTVAVGPGLQNNFSLVNAYTWEDGRGFRCDWWRSTGISVPQ
jgi:carboxylesterase type B